MSGDAAMLAVVTLYLRGVAALMQGAAPVIAAIATFVQRLQEQCPEAFDDAGRLRPDWQEIVAAKFAAAPKIDPVTPLDGN